jgi:multidrug efflux pump subunit AcrB
MDTLRAAGSAKTPVAYMDQLKAQCVRSANGAVVPVDKIAAVELLSGPTAVYRVDLCPAVRIIGSPPEGKKAGPAASRCAELADSERKSQGEPAGFAVVNLAAQ